MKLGISHFLLSALAGASFTQAAESPVFEEDFSGAPVITWNTSGSDAVLTLDNSAQELQLTGTGDRTLFTTFNAETLTNVGSSVRGVFSFNVSDSAQTTSIDRAFRFGLWDEGSSRAGYLAEIDLFEAAGTSFETLANDGNGSRLGGGGLRSLDQIADSTTFIGNGTDHELEFLIERTSASAFAISTTLDGQLIFTSTDAIGNLSTFDTLGFRIADTGAAELDLSDAALFADAIPEPSSALLILLAAGTLACRRSR